MAAAKKPVEKTIDEEIEADERRAVEGSVEVDLSEPDDVDDPDEEPAQQPSRKEKRAARGKLREEADALRARVETAEREAAEARARAAEAAGWAQGQRAALQGPQKDPIDVQLERVEAANEELIATIRAEE